MVFSPKILKENQDIFSKILSDHLNNSITMAKFRNNLKHADITPAFKKDDQLIKPNYRPHYLRYTKDIYKQIYQCFENIFEAHLWLSQRLQFSALFNIYAQKVKKSH